jgi:DNA-binding transcriptional regulator YiaG
VISCATLFGVRALWESATRVGQSPTRRQRGSAGKNSIAQRFARTLKALREECDLSPDVFSERSGISIPRLRKLESPEEADPRLDELARIAATFHISVPVLMNWVES